MAGDRPADPGRRQFFRTVGRETAASAGRAIGAADSLRRGTTAVAGELLGLGLGDPATNAGRLDLAPGASSAAGPAATTGTDRFSGAYRFTGEELLLLDQRLLPGQRVEVACRDGTDVAAALRTGVVGGGPVLAEVAAYGMFLTPPARRRAVAAELVAARPAVHAIRSAVERVAAADQPLQEADAVASEAALAHASLGRLGADALPRVEGRALTLLLHGDMGPLASGLVGTGVAVLQSLLAGGRPVHAWLTEGGPGAPGRRISAPQLLQLDIPHTVLDDAAIGWLLGSRPVDAVLVRADTVFVNGDCATPLGGATVATVARSAAVPVYACAPASAFDADTPTGHPLPLEMAVATGAPRPEPLTDLVPAHLLAGVMTEHGVLQPPFVPSRPSATA